jgi:hypothetical protein
MSKMNRTVTFLTIAISLGLPQGVYAAACTQNKNVLDGRVGLDSSNGTVYAVTNSTSNECSCVETRFTQANTDTQTALSILLSAKISSKKVRIDFLDGSNCNSAYRVYLE